MLATLLAGTTGLVVLLGIYMPASLERSAGEALGHITRLDVSLDSARMAGIGHADFAEAVFYRDSQRVASLAPMAIHGALSPSGRWTVESLSAGTWRLALDLDSPASAMAVVRDFLSLHRRLHPYARAIESAAPEGGFEEIEVDIFYRGQEPLRFEAEIELPYGDCAALVLTAARLEKRPPAWRVVAAEDGISLNATLEGVRGELAERVLEVHGAALRPFVEDMAGSLEASWTSAGEKVRLAADDKWYVDTAAADSHGMTLPEGEVTITIREIAFHNNALSALSGSVRLAAERMPSCTLWAWIRAAGLTHPSADDEPEYFVSLSLAADFEIVEGALGMVPMDDAPGLVWASVEGEDIVIFTGSAETRLADFLNRARLIKPSDLHEHEGAEDDDDPENDAFFEPAEQKEVPKGQDKVN